MGPGAQPPGFLIEPAEVAVELRYGINPEQLAQAGAIGESAPIRLLNAWQHVREAATAPAGDANWALAGARPRPFGYGRWPGCWTMPAASTAAMLKTAPLR